MERPERAAVLRAERFEQSAALEGRGQVYFHFEVDEKLLPFAIEVFGKQCWVYGSDIPHGDRLYGAVDVFLKRSDISVENKRKLLVENTARFYGLSQ